MFNRNGGGSRGGFGDRKSSGGGYSGNRGGGNFGRRDSGDRGGRMEMHKAVSRNAEMTVKFLSNQVVKDQSFAVLALETKMLVHQDNHSLEIENQEILAGIFLNQVFTVSVMNIVNVQLITLKNNLKL
jgi:hypothetical protein